MHDLHEETQHTRDAASQALAQEQVTCWLIVCITRPGSQYVVMLMPGFVVRMPRSDSSFIVGDLTSAAMASVNNHTCMFVQSCAA